MMKLLGVLAFAMMIPMTAGCAATSEDEDVDSDTADLEANGIPGVDYAWARPSPAYLEASGYKFAVRYLSFNTTGKNLTKEEADALRAEGIDVVSNWEWRASDALGGFELGAKYAMAAEEQALAAGMPAGRPIYFSVDWDAQESEQAVINDYFDGVASVIGRERTGAYGGYRVIKRLFDANKITWGWQTYAWSAKQWDLRAQLRQVKNGIEGGTMDKDLGMAADFGQWGAAPAPAPPPPAE
jgi:hypothetical protein